MESSATLPAATCRRVLGRYALYGEIAHGGMATVHLGRLLGPAGFSRTVAIKRLHPQYAKDAEFVAMFRDEARLVARIRHPNVVPTLDVLGEDEVFLVLEYVHGESLARILRRMKDRNERIPPGVCASIMCGVLSGLHAAHEATGEDGEPLAIVHRDMSPQNVMVCADGLARVLDFGIAKARGRVHTTREGQLKGKLAYIAPEQLQQKPIDRRTDVYAAAVTLWELCTGRKLFKGDTEWDVMGLIREGRVAPPSEFAPELPPALDAVVMRGLAADPAARFATAREMEAALEQAVPLASPRQVGAWLESVASDSLRARQQIVAQIEAATAVVVAPEGSESSSSVAESTRTGSAPSAIARRVSPVPPPPSSRNVVAVAPASGNSATGTSGALLATHLPVLPEAPRRSRSPRRVAFGVAALAAAVSLFVWRGRVEPRAAPPAAASPVAAPPTVFAAHVAPVERGVGVAPVERGVGVAPVERGVGVAPVERGVGVAPAARGVGVAPATAARARALRGRGHVAPDGERTPSPPPRAVEPAAAGSSSAERPAADCEPPYTVDAIGIRHPKPECL